MIIPDTPDYHDRRTGLILFGIFEVLIGIFWALAIPLMLFAQMMASRRTGARPAPFMPFFMITMYALLAVIFVGLGIGSILARRWARAILLCLSAVGLCGGLIAGAFLSLLLPHIGETMAQPNQPPLPPAAYLMAKITIVVVVLVFYILIPGVLFLFYRRPHVKRTCEVRDPVERWTDRSPLPVLAGSLVLAFSGICMLSMQGSIHGFPLFGFFVSGGAGSIVTVLFAGLFLYLAWGLYRLQIRVWRITLGLQLILWLSGIVTFWRTGLTALYLKMGFDQRATASAGHLINSPAFKWLVLISVVPWVVWLLWIRRYFRAPPAAAALPEGTG